MSHSRILVSIAALSLLLAACGGGAGSSSVVPSSPGQSTLGTPSDPSQSLQPQTTASPASITASGTITNVFTNGFTMQTGVPHGYINVITSSSTVYSGAKPFDGENVTVNATGSWSTQLQAITVTQAGFATPSPAPTAPAAPASIATPAATTTPSSPAPFPTPMIYTSGSITGLFTGGFTMQTGVPHGYINVHTTASTVFTGAKPYTGESVQVAATGSWSTSLTAVDVTQAGYATPTPQPTPYSTPPPPPAVIPAHITTWAYDEYWARGANGTTAQVRQYLSYAQGGLGNNKAAVDCTGSGACKSVFYFDPHMIYDNSQCGNESVDVKAFLNAANETWFVHEAGYTDYAHRLRGSYNQSCNGAATIPVWAINTSNPSVATYFQSYMHTYAGQFDDFFMDDTSGAVLTQFFGPGGGFCQDATNHMCTSTQELPTDASVVNEHATLANALTHTDGSPMQGVFNGFNFSNGYPSDLNVVQASNHFIGIVCENCVVDQGVLQPSMYASMLNAMAEVNTIPGASAIELNSGSSAAGSATQLAQRAVTTAIAWLGYSDGHTIVWPDLEANTQNLEIFPENSIYPASPLQTMHTGAMDLAVANGVYRREFVNCYNSTAPIGACAAIVNASGSTVTVQASWLQQTYGHTVQMTGGDIPSGGTISLTTQPFAVNSTTIAPGQAILIVR